MKTEVGDYVIWSVTSATSVVATVWMRGVVIAVIEEPHNMGASYTIITRDGELHHVKYYEELTCNYGRMRSDHHEWLAGEQEEYDSLVADGRRLYDQLRTRLKLSHDHAFVVAQGATRRRGSDGRA